MLSFLAMWMATAAPAEGAGIRSANPEVDAVHFDSQSYKVSISFVTPHVPAKFELTNGFIIFSMRVDGEEIWAVLDTGAERTVLDSGLAQNLGLRLIDKGQLVRSPNASIPSKHAENVSLAIEGQLTMVTPVAVLDLTKLSSMAGRPVSAVFGADFLSRLEVVINHDRSTLDFAPSGAKIPPAHVPFLKIDGMKVPVKVGSSELWLKLDTGMTGDISLIPSVWERIRPEGAQTHAGLGFGMDGKAVSQEQGTLPEIQIGMFAQKNVRVSVRDWRGTDGVLGEGLLRRFNVLMDIALGKMWLAPRRSESLSGGAAP